MFFIEKSHYNLRNTRARKRKITFRSATTIPRKRLRSFDPFDLLPNETLLYIFSFLGIEDLYFNVRRVCKKWHKLAMLSSPWTKVTAGNHIPSHVLKNWIRTCPKIKKLEILHRNDANVVLENTSKFCRHLENISIEDCWGSTRNVYLNSGALCNLLTRCKNLQKINFDKVKIRSCKFFKLLAKRRNNGKSMQLSYVGPVTTKQYITLREACSGWIFTEFVEIDIGN